MTLLKGVSKWLEGPTEINTVYVPAKTKRDIKEVRKDIKSQPTKPAGINKSITKSTGAKKVVVVMNKNGRLQRVNPEPKPPQAQQSVKSLPPAHQVAHQMKSPTQSSEQPQSKPKEDILAVIKRLSAVQLQQLIETSDTTRIMDIYNLLMKQNGEEAVNTLQKFPYKAQQLLFLKLNIEQQRKLYDHLPKYMQRQIYERLTPDQQRKLDRAQAQNRTLLPSVVDAINGTRSTFNNSGRNTWNGSTGGYDGTERWNEMSALKEQIRKLKEDKKQNENEKTLLEKEKLEAEVKASKVENEELKKKLQTKEMSNSYGMPTPELEPTKIPADDKKKLNEMKNQIPNMKSNETLVRELNGTANLHSLLQDFADFQTAMKDSTGKEKFNEVFPGMVNPFDQILSEEGNLDKLKDNFAQLEKVLNEKFKEKDSEAKNAKGFDKPNKEKVANAYKTMLEICRKAQNRYNITTSLKDFELHHANIINKKNELIKKRYEAVVNLLKTNNFDDAYKEIDDASKMLNDTFVDAAEKEFSDKNDLFKAEINKAKAEIEQNLLKYKESVRNAEKEYNTNKEKTRNQTQTKLDEELEAEKKRIDDKIKEFADETIDPKQFDTFIQEKLKKYDGILNKFKEKAGKDDLDDIKQKGYNDIHEYINRLCKFWNKDYKTYNGCNSEMIDEEINKILAKK